MDSQRPARAGSGDPAKAARNKSVSIIAEATTLNRGVEASHLLSKRRNYLSNAEIIQCSRLHHDVQKPVPQAGE
jgi:hypothetical protein